MNKAKFETSVHFEESNLVQELLGSQGRNLMLIHEKTGVSLESRGNTVFLQANSQSQLELVQSLLSQLYALLTAGYKIHPQDVESAIRILSKQPQMDLLSFFRDNVFVVSPKKTISPKSLTQSDYLSSIRKNDLTFGIGPAGTGKTYLAVAAAVSCLMKKQVKRLILTRPAVEAGEKLGFLPGDLAEKINPYLRPLYDALHDMLDFNRVQEMIDTGIIEVAPLAFMRGRTLNNSFIILDEAQNTTPEQMKMFLTRMGFGSRAVVTGDITQIDLPGKSRSGLVMATKILNNVRGAHFIRFSEADVIRHPLVARIVRAYDKFEVQESTGDPTE